jgi:hypothetical protein
MGGPLNRNGLTSCADLFAPIPAIPGPARLSCLGDAPRPWEILLGMLFSAGQLEIRSPRIRVSAGSVDNRLDRLPLARLNAAVEESASVKVRGT